MGITAIISEFNPFHLGHEYLVHKAKEIKPQNDVIILMSGNLVQRGELSIADKFSRSIMALSCGVDMCLELPTIYATAPANVFAFGAVKLLSQLPDVDTLVFGSMTGDINILTHYMELMDNENTEFQTELKRQLKCGLSYPKALSNTLSVTSHKCELSTIENVLNSPNDVLGIEYLRAIKAFNCNITPHTIKRTQGELVVSASSIRQRFNSNDNQDITKYLPKELASFTNEFIDQNSANERLFTLIKYKLLTSPIEQIQSIYDISEGIENRILNAIEKSTSYEEFLNNIKTKRFTMAKIKRILLSILLDKTQSLVENAYSNLQYVKVLSIRKEKRHLLSQNSNITLVKTTADISQIPPNSTQYMQLDKRSDELFHICTNSKCTDKLVHQMAVAVR